VKEIEVLKAVEVQKPIPPPAKESETPSEVGCLMDEIFEAARKGNLESIAFLLSKDKSLLEKKDEFDLLSTSEDSAPCCSPF
jgi:hypothetical protein